MAIGAVIRRLLGARLARKAGRCYRAIFVDLRKEAALIASLVPAGSHILDVGGGDGEPLNYLLALRPDLRITTLDPAPVVGQWIESRFSQQVRRLPETKLATYVESHEPDPDIVLLSDVMHHVPIVARFSFLEALRSLVERSPRTQILVKDVEPGHWRAKLGYWSDRFITGDKHVSPISRDRLIELFEERLRPIQCRITGLYELDKPNYAVMFSR